MKMFEDVSDEEINEISINKNYAKKFEYNKKRQELEKLKEKYKDVSEDESSTSEEEDEDGELITPQVDVKIMKTLELIKNKDASVYDPEIKFFDQGDVVPVSSTKEKPIYLKDYHRNALINQNVEEPGTFVSEQSKLKDELKDAIKKFDDEDDDEEIFTKRVANNDEGEEYSKFILSQVYGNDPVKSDWNKLKEKVDDEQKFLLDYVLHKGWVDSDSKQIPTFEQVTQHALHDTTDEEEEEEIENYEMQHNFRFEEGGAESVITHSRDVPGVIRRKDNKRILQRQTLKERKEEEKKKKREELKRLKNLKKEELAQKLKQIQEMAGGELIGIEKIDLTKDFDPAEHDQVMNQMFTEEYFESKDWKVKKPVFENDIDISDLIDEPESKIIDYSAVNKNAEFKDMAQHEIEKYMEEYYRLDFEDMVGDLPVRFKYKKIEANDYNLKPQEILEADDADLNNVISLKKLGPFRSEQQRIHDDYKWKKTKKRKLWEFRSKLKGKPVEIPKQEIKKQNSFLPENRLSSYSSKKQK